MLLTVTISTPKYLCVQDNNLVIKERHEDKVLDKIPLSDIWVIIIDNPKFRSRLLLWGKSMMKVLAFFSAAPTICPTVWHSR